MGIKYSNKINKIRTFALSLVFIGLFIAYLGVFFRENIIIMTTFMMVGFLAVIASTVVYFWIGMLSTKTVQIICPSCDKPTKMLGRVDACMHCNQPLTMDRNLEGKEFNEKYNKKSYKSQAHMSTVRKMYPYRAKHQKVISWLRNHLLYLFLIKLDLY